MKVISVTIVKNYDGYKNLIMNHLENMADRLRPGDIIELADLPANETMEINHMRHWQVTKRKVYAYK